MSRERKAGRISTGRTEIADERDCNKGAGSEQEIPDRPAGAGKCAPERVGANTASAVEALEARKEGDVLGTEGRAPGSEARRGAGADRKKRRGKDDAAEDFKPDHEADVGLGRNLRASGKPAGSRNGIPSGAFGAGQHLFEWRDIGDVQARD